MSQAGTPALTTPRQAATAGARLPTSPAEPKPQGSRATLTDSDSVANLGSSLRLTHSRSQNIRPSYLPSSSKRGHLEELMSSYLSEKPSDISQFIANHVEYTLARQAEDMDDFGAYQATAYSVRDRLIEFWNDTQRYFWRTKTKMVYYMSIEYLIGRSLQNAIMNLQLEGEYGQSLKEVGFELERLYEEESDAALGNGGLGRLAACFLDSLASMDLPAWGYGIRYRYGMFKQAIRNGDQIELPDYWLSRGNPWEIVRNEIAYPIRFYGFVNTVLDEKGALRFTWEGGIIVNAVAHDTPVPGYGTLNTINLRLWSSRPTTEIDFDFFNKGDYYEAVKQRQDSESITSVLYPNDATPEGRELRLKQQFFFASASLQDILARHKKVHAGDLLSFGQHVAIQLNDTHPAVSTAELMRLLVDIERIPWDEAWRITTETFAYTNHTVMPEALEEWPVPMFGRLLPRHLQIIYEINHRFLTGPVEAKWPGDAGKKQEMSIIREGNPQKIRMAILAIVASHSLNGVAFIHTEILKKSLFRSFYELWPEKFNNKTNGVTPRRWINSANRALSALLTAKLGSDVWVTKLDELAQLRAFADDPTFQYEFAKTKIAAKDKLRAHIFKVTAGKVDPSPTALFDVQVKRIHEYKRQLLNILGVIHRYLQLKKMTPAQRTAAVPRVIIFGGKAAPAYVAAKATIKLISSVAEVINRDSDIGDLLKVVFLPNYNVSLAEIIIPASDISQHISTAGTEASGTSNMKFAMNGGLILGTLDGANIEMMEEIGEENMFIFGLKADDIEAARKMRLPIDERLHEVIMAIFNYQFADERTTNTMFRPLLQRVLEGTDFYLVSRDFASYIDAQRRIDETWQNKPKWRKMCINTIAGMGKFSSDRTIAEYAKDIWGVSSVRVPEMDKDSTIYHT